MALYFSFAFTLYLFAFLRVRLLCVYKCCIDAMANETNDPSSDSDELPPVPDGILSGNKEAPKRKRVTNWAVVTTRRFIALRAELNSQFNSARKGQHHLWTKIGAILLQETTVSYSNEQLRNRYRTLILEYKAS